MNFGNFNKFAPVSEFSMLSCPLDDDRLKFKPVGVYPTAFEN